MTFYYEVYHIENPNGGVRLAFKEKQTPMRVRDKACRDGHFKWKFYTELRVRRVKAQPIPLEAFTEVEA